MNRSFRLVLPLAIACMLRADDLRIPAKAAAEIEKELSSAPRVELLSLHGGEPDGSISEEDAKVKFHGFAVLGALDITTAPERGAIVKQVSAAIGRSPLRMVACFFPRHGIRADLGGGKQLELLICFECSTVYRYAGGKQLRLNIDDKPESLLNSVIQKAGIRHGASARGPGV